jgi:hypothetical protein
VESCCGVGVRAVRPTERLIGNGQQIQLPVANTTIPAPSNQSRAAAQAAEVPAAVPIPIQLEASAIQSKADQDTLLAQFKPMGEATSDQLKTGRVVGAVDGLVVLHVGRGSYVSHKLPAGAVLPTVGQELNQQQRSGITR